MSSELIENSFPSDISDITGKSSKGKVGRVNFDLPHSNVKLLSLTYIKISEPSGSFLTMSCKVCAGTVIFPSDIIFVENFSLMSISISVAIKFISLPTASITKFDKIAIAFFLSTTELM